MEARVLEALPLRCISMAAMWVVGNQPPAASLKTRTRPLAPATANPSQRPSAPKWPPRVSGSHCTLHSGPPSSTRPVHTHSRRSMSQMRMRPLQSTLARRSPVELNAMLKTHAVCPRS